MTLIVASALLLGFVAITDLHTLAVQPTTFGYPTDRRRVVALTCLLVAIGVRQNRVNSFLAFLACLFFVLSLPIFWRDARKAAKGLYRVPVSPTHRLTRVTLSLGAALELSRWHC